MVGMESNHDKGPVVWRDVAALVALAFVYRLAFMLAMRRVIDSPDAVLYLNLAKDYAAGHFLEVGPRIPLLYSALCAAVHTVVPDIELAGRFVSLAASSLLIVPVYLLSHELHGKRVARVTALLVCLWPWLTDYGSRVMPEALTSFLWFFSIWALMRCLRRGGFWTIVAPLSFFALHLARPEGTLLLLAAPVGALILLRKDNGRDLIRLVPFVIVATLLLVAFALVMHKATGVATISYRVTDPEDAFHTAFILRGAHLLRVIPRTLFEVIPLMLGPYMVLFAGVGIFRASRPDRDFRLESFVLYFGAVQVLAVVLSTLDQPRYIINVAIAASFWSARGMVLVSDQAAGLAKGRWLKWAPVGVLASLMVLGSVATIAPEYLGRMGRMPREYKIAGHWMRDNLEPGLIFARNAQLGFYADMETSGPAAGESIEAGLARAATLGARYVVIDQRYAATKTPAWQPLLDPANAPPPLHLIRDDLSPIPDARIVIYEIVRPGDSQDSS